jgi:SAM-dependent methyltransferase
VSAVIDMSRVEALVERVIDETGAAMTVPLVVIGTRLGLYRAMADGNPVDAAELAGRTGTHERYVHEWLIQQAASGFVAYDPDAETFTLPAEAAAVLADERSPAYQGGMFQSVSAAVRAQDEVLERFRSGDGLGWHEHHHDLFDGVADVFALAYREYLVRDWIPALEGVEQRLADGIAVADVGCGLGISTILLAEAFPRSRFAGYDAHPESIHAARENARVAGVSDRVTFEVATAAGYPGSGYGLVACFDALHDMGDPAGAARHVRDTLADDGVWMIVEPMAGDRVEENLHPLGRLSYGFSNLVCTPGSLSQEGRAGLGTLAGERRLAEVIREGGFTSVRRAAEKPFNLVLEARP